MAEEVTPGHRIVLPCHHEDSNLVYRVTKAAFYLSNSGGLKYGENQHLKKEQLLCHLSYRPIEVDPPGLEPGTHRFGIEVTLFFASPYRADGGDRTHDACLEDRHVPATPRPLAAQLHCVQTGGVEPPPRGPEPRVLPLHHV